jgi:glycosyltransferase involved in cell wall biosynthesis
MSNASTKPIPEIAAIVISFGDCPFLINAVRSLCQQDVAAEIVVVHSGAGDPEARLADAGLKVPVISSAKRLFAGGARNLGIKATTAPYVAFLADDCVAEPGWLQERVRLHQAGASAVASSLLCHRPNHPVALAAHLSLYVRRMPRAHPSVALAYGASYARALFATYGLFRDDLESGEDTEFHQRLDPSDQPQWQPQIRTIHRGAETLAGFLSSQYRRGQQMAKAWGQIGLFTPGFVARNALERTGLILRESLQVVESQHRLATVCALPLIILGSLVYACGALAEGRRR